MIILSFRISTRLDFIYKYVSVTREIDQVGGPCRVLDHSKWTRCNIYIIDPIICDAADRLSFLHRLLYAPCRISIKTKQNIKQQQEPVSVY